MVSTGALKSDNFGTQHRFHLLQRPDVCLMIKAGYPVTVNSSITLPSTGGVVNIMAIPPKYTPFIIYVSEHNNPA